MSQQPAAAGSSFYAGMKVLPREERHAMYAVYDFCRIVDDIADDQQGDRPARMAALDRWRADLASLYAGGDPGVAAMLVPHIRRFGLAREDFEAVIDGMATDIDADVRWPAADALDLYCDRVASAVGRLSVRIFGMERQEGIDLSHHLGRALQLTNILRDIDEDAGIGRVYLPREAIEAQGIQVGDIGRVIGDPRIDGAARILAAEAQDHFREAQRILDARPKGHLVAPRLMAAAYSQLLRRMQKAGWKPPRERVRHNRIALAWTLLRLRLGR
jgi:presqualene diphosphate synthase